MPTYGRVTAGLWRALGVSAAPEAATGGRAFSFLLLYTRMDTASEPYVARRLLRAAPAQSAYVGGADTFRAAAHAAQRTYPSGASRRRRPLGVLVQGYPSLFGTLTTVCCATATWKSARFPRCAPE